MSILSKYKIIKELGHGMIGTVYLISVPKSKTRYALKIERIEKRDLKPNSKSSVWREINFCKKFASKYPEQFIQMLEYDFIDTCTHIQTYSYEPKLFSQQVQNKLNRLESSEYCVRKVFDLVDGELHQLINKLNLKQIYSMIIQVTYSINLLHSNNYIHGDIHDRNIGWIKTPSNKQIQINRTKVPTFGYNFKLIDYGLIMRKTDIVSKQDEKNFNDNLTNELGLIAFMLVDTKFYEFVNKNNIELNFDKNYREFKKSAWYKLISTFTPNKLFQLFLFDIMFQEQYQKMVLGEKFEKTIKTKLYVPLEDIVFIIKNYSKPNWIIRYFSSKIKKTD